MLNWNPTVLRGALPRLLLILAISLFALIVTACGDDDDGNGTPSPTPAADASPAAMPDADASPDTSPEASPPADDADGAFPLSITDTGGHELTLETAPERIVSHSPGATEILFAIGAGDRVIAVDEFSDYPPEAIDLQSVAYSDPDPEHALSLEPDLVIFGGRQQGSIEQFRSLDLPVFYNGEAEGIDALLENILTLGAVTGQEDEAEDLVQSMRDRIEAIEAEIADVDEGPRVFWEVTDDLYTVAPDTFIGDMLARLKAENIAAGATTQYPQLTNEAVIEANPEVILMANHEWVEMDQVPERPGWDAIDAVLNERIHPVDGDQSSRPGPRIVDAMEEAAAALYPDRFE